MTDVHFLSARLGLFERERAREREGGRDRAGEKIKEAGRK